MYTYAYPILLLDTYIAHTQYSSHSNPESVDSELLLTLAENWFCISQLLKPESGFCTPITLAEYQFCTPVTLAEYQFFTPVTLAEYQFFTPVTLAEYQFFTPVTLAEYQFCTPVTLAEYADDRDSNTKYTLCPRRIVRTNFHPIKYEVMNYTKSCWILINWL
jgi:hypothetical protein